MPTKRDENGKFISEREPEERYRELLEYEKRMAARPPGQSPKARSNAGRKGVRYTMGPRLPVRVDRCRDGRSERCERTMKIYNASGHRYSRCCQCTAHFYARIH